MTPFQLLTVAESALRQVDHNRRVGNVSLSSIHDDLRRNYNFMLQPVGRRELRSALLTLFPIHKNMRRRNRKLKIRPEEAYEYFDSKRIRLRPFDHIQRTK